MISVLIPAYNAERYLAEAIDSVLAQTYQDFELIVIDDGSRDRTRAIAADYASRDPHVRVISHPNKGMGEALNGALEAAAHEWIARLDADDRMLPHRLQRQLAFLKAHPGLAVVSSLVEFIDEQGRSFGVSRSPFTTPQAVEQAIRQNQVIGVHHPAVIMRKSVVLAVGGYRRAYWPSDDLDLWNRIAEQGHSLLVQPEVLTQYRIHGQSVCVASAREANLKIEWIVDSIFMRRSGRQERTWEEFLAFRRGMPWPRRLNLERKNLARILYKAAIHDLSLRRYPRLVPKLLGSLALEPNYIMSRIFPRLFAR